MHRRWLWLAASVVAVAVAAACSSFDASNDAAVSPDASADGSADDASVADGSAKADAKPSTACGVSTAKTIAPMQDCLKTGSPVDVTSSTTHCGQCNHSCLGAMCAGGLCAPAQLYVRGGIALGDVGPSNAYYATGPDVQRVSLDDAGTVEVVARTDESGFAVSAFLHELDRLYVETRLVNTTKIGRVDSIASKDAGIVPLVTSVGEGLASDATNLYWNAYSSIHSVGKNGGLEATVQSNSQADLIRGMAGNKGDFYWLRLKDAGNTDQELFRRSFDGTITQLASKLGNPIGLALDDTHVYWADMTTHMVMRIPRAGGKPAPVAQWPGANGYVKALIVEKDKGIVYWAVTDAAESGTDATIYQAPTCAEGGAVTVVAHPGGEFAAGLFTDNFYLYYGGLGGIWRVVR